MVEQGAVPAGGLTQALHAGGSGLRSGVKHHAGSRLTETRKRHEKRGPNWKIAASGAPEGAASAKPGAHALRSSPSQGGGRDADLLKAPVGAPLPSCGEPRGREARPRLPKQQGRRSASILHRSRRTSNTLPWRGRVATRRSSVGAKARERGGVNIPYCKESSPHPGSHLVSLDVRRPSPSRGG